MEERCQSSGVVGGGKLTDDQLDVIAGKRDQLAGKIQEAYGITKEAAEKQLTEWQNWVKDTLHLK